MEKYMIRLIFQEEYCKNYEVDDIKFINLIVL